MGVAVVMGSSVGICVGRIGSLEMGVKVAINRPRVGVFVGTGVAELDGRSEQPKMKIPSANKPMSFFMI